MARAVSERDDLLSAESGGAIVCEIRGIGVGSGGGSKYSHCDCGPAAKDILMTGDGC